MNHANRNRVLVVSCLILTVTNSATGQDWPQWRGPNRDGKAVSFKAPAAWPKELTEKWKVTVGEGVATPALVGDRLFVFARQDANEILRCLDASSGKEIWQDRYESAGASGPASSFSGPRSSPTVAEGKVVTLGVRGMLSCLDAASGKVLWRKDDFKAIPRFHPSSSPIVVEGLCIAQLGGPGNGGVVAYDLKTGNEKWKWTDDAPAYASPSLMTIDGAKLVVAQTERRVVALNAADGKLAWEAPAAVRGRGYNSASPTVEGRTLFYGGSGRGTTASRLEKEGGNLVAKELWTNAEKSVEFNTPVHKNGHLFGVTQANELFCINAENGQLVWAAPVTSSAGNAGGSAGGGGRGGRGGGYASIVDAGSVLLALTPASELIVLEPNAKAYTEVARIKVANSPTYAHPVVSGNRLFVKDADSIALFVIN